MLFTGTDEGDVERVANAAAHGFAGDPIADVEMLGPAPQPLARLRGRHRWHLMPKSSNAARLREAVLRALDATEAKGLPRTVSVAPDVDPVDVL